MAINTEVLNKNNIKWLNNEFIVLQAIQQKQKDDFEEKVLESLLAKELINEKHKITPKGTKLLREVGVLGLTEESKYLTKKLINLYESHGLLIKNKKRVGGLVAWFIGETGYEPRHIYEKVQEYILSVSEKMYVSELGNLFWKAPNVYATKYTLDDSKLYSIWNNY